MPERQAKEGYITLFFSEGAHRLAKQIGDTIGVDTLLDVFRFSVGFTAYVCSVVAAGDELSS